VAEEKPPHSFPRREAGEAMRAPAVARVREEDLEPHAGLRYVARLFKVLALLLLLMLVAEIVIGLTQQGTAALPTLLVEATRMVVFAGFLWGAGDMALMLIESNHDLRATRILLGRMNGRMQRWMEHAGVPRTGGPPEEQQTGPDGIRTTGATPLPPEVDGMGGGGRST
jgi:hypothetical protein